MSWQTYVDSSIIGTGKVAEAAIFGHDGSLWASSPGLTSLSANEASILISAFSNATAIRESGLHVAGRRYIVFRSDERSIYGKAGKDGLVAVKTGQAVLVGVYREPQQPGEATKVVEGLADYLIGVGY